MPGQWIFSTTESEWDPNLTARSDRTDALNRMRDAILFGAPFPVHVPSTAVTSGSFVDVCSWDVHAPAGVSGLTLYVNVQTDVGTTGELKLNEAVSGDGNTITIASGTASGRSSGALSVSLSSFLALGGFTTIKLRARRASGAGNFTVSGAGNLWGYWS